MSALDDVLAALRSRGCNPRQSGSGWSARCPAHKDSTPSLSVSQGSSGVVMHCHAGCSGEAVIDALGLTMADLFDEPKTARREVAAYTYEDEQGAPLYEVVRFEPKDFRQRQPDGTWGVKGVRKVLYRLPAVLAIAEAGGTIYVCEGEKDADAINAIEGNHVATCNAGGAGKWRDDYNAALRGSNVVVVQDKDEPGRAHAAAVAASLSGVAASCRIVEAKTGKDAADHLAAGHGLQDFVAVGEPESKPGLRIYTLVEIEAMATEVPTSPAIFPGWLVSDIHTHAAPAFSGKNYLAFSVAVQLARCLPILLNDAWQVPRPISSLFLEEEMSLEEVDFYFRRVLAGLGVERKNLEGLVDFLPLQAGFTFADPADAESLHRTLEQRRKEGRPVDLLWVDSITQCSGIKKQADPAEVRAFHSGHLMPLRREHGCGITNLHHTNKAAWSKQKLVTNEALLSGSEQFLSAPSSASIMLPAKNKAQRVIELVKGRRSGKLGRWAFKVEFVNPPGMGDPVRLEWAGDHDGEDEDETQDAGPAQSKVVAILKAQPAEWFTRQQLAEAAEVSLDTVDRILKGIPIERDTQSRPQRVRLVA